MSGGKDGSSAGGRHTFLGRFIDSFRRPSPQVRQEQRPIEEDLGLKTLRNVYSQYVHTEDPADKERRLYTMLPLFLKNCSRLKGPELITKFPECLEFSEHVAMLFVRQVIQLAQMHGTRACEALLKFLDVESEREGIETGILMLRVLQVFSEGPQQLVDAMMSSDLSSILVRCVHLFLDLPPPTPPLQHRTLSGGRGSPVAATASGETEGDPDPHSRHGQRVVLQKLLTFTLTHLCRHLSAVECLLRLNDLSLLFGAISSPCPPYNKIWRKAAGDCLLAIFRHSLSNEVIHFVHTKGCIGFCIRNIQLSVDQPPLDLVEIFATIFCCLKDSSDMSQILIEDFAAHGGHKFLFDYLLYLERKDNNDSREAVRNMVFLISGLVTAGFHPVELAVSEVGPFQDEGFSLPKPVGPGSSVRNVDIFLVLQDAFLKSESDHLGKTLLDTILNIYRSDPVNYFILESQRTLTAFLEIMPSKSYHVQKHIFQLLEHVMVDLNYVPIPELTSLGLILQQREYPKTISLGLNFLLRLISHTPRYKDVFREVGILQVLVNALGAYGEDLRENEEEEDHPEPHGELASPSLPLPELQGDTEEYIFLLIECLRATIEGNVQNGQVFREYGGSRLTLELVTYHKPRRMALRLITHLILLPDGSVDFNSLLDQLNCSAQTAVTVKSEILRTVLRVFQLDSHKKAVFREVCGFHYLISTLASLIGSLAPRRSVPWVGVPRSEVLTLVQLVFVVLMSAMQDDPANKMFFETNIRFQSFTAPLLLLGCFSRDVQSFQPTPADEVIFTSPGFQTFEAEFKTWQQPGEKLDERSFVFSAAEVFRFLRDMALDVPMTQSTSLLQVKQQKSVFGSSTRLTGHLVHPGAVLCMVDLLPSVCMSTQLTAEEGEEHSVSSENSAVLPGNGQNHSGVVVAINGETTLDHERTKLNHLEARERVGEVVGHVVLEPAPVRNSRESSVETELRLEISGSEGTKLEKTYCKLSPVEAKMWCVFLQERVVTEIFSMAMTERNQQALCEVYLPQRILQRCGAVLADETHPLHQSLERTFERLSYQALTPSDFRSFLRLGNPLCCNINDITIEQLEREGSGIGPIVDQADPSPDVQESLKQEEKSTHLDSLTTESNKLAQNNTNKSKVSNLAVNQKKKYGGSLSLARIQSLVSMTTPRSSNLSNLLGSPSFIEIDHSIDGFGCLFLPSVFPQTVVQQIQGQVQSPSAVSTSGVGYGVERPFPPNSGLTFSCWFYVSSVTSNDETPFSLLSLSHNFLGVDSSIASVPCFRILANFATESLIVTIQSTKDQIRDTTPDDTKSDRVDTVSFPCPQLSQLQVWHHVVVTVAKTMRQKSKVSLFVDGMQLGVQKCVSQKCKVHLYVDNKFLGRRKMAYIRSVAAPEESIPHLINAHIGTHVSQRHVSDLLIRLGPVCMFDDHISPQTASVIHKLGPSYFGSFQAPVVGDTSLSSPGVSGDPLPPLLPEDRVLFGISFSHPAIKTVCELGKTYSTLDTAVIARELLLAESDDATPVQLLHNTSYHLYGPSRTLGAIICGYTGIRSFQPQPLRELLSSVGGTSVMLGLVATATSVDALYASMKALVCIVGNNQVALKEMERTGGFQVLAMLLRGKSRLINGNILHLTFTLVGTVDSEHESACIPNPIAFRDLLADLSVWSGTIEEIQRSLLAHFFDLLTHTRAHSSNTSHMQDMKLVWLLLFRIHDDRLSRATIKSICNVVNAILGRSPSHEDLRRVGQLMVTTLAHRDESSENKIDIYTDTVSRQSPAPQPASDDSWSKEEGRVKEERRCRDIVLRNMMMDMVLSLLCPAHMELDTRFALLLSEAVGLDWILLFLHRNTHTDTVTRALRILVQLLSIEKLQQKLHEGDIFGPWVKGFENLPPELTSLLETSVTQVNPFKPNSQFPLPGVAILSHLLPHHLHSPQVFLLMIAFLLGKTGLDIPFSATFDMETLDNAFQVGNSSAMTSVRLCPDAAFVLLAMARVMLHQTLCESQTPNTVQAPVDLLIKFLERLYRTLPTFCSMATGQQFVEALAATLFPPHTVESVVGSKEGEMEGSNMLEYDDEEYVVLVKDTGDSTHHLQQSQHESHAALLRARDVAVCSIIQLLRTIAVDGFAGTQPAQRDTKPVCQVLELVLSASPSAASPDLQNKYQTLILDSILDHLQVGNEDVTVIFHSTASGVFTRAMTGLGVFCSRLVDKLWQGVYLEPSLKVYNFLLLLVEQALKQPNVLPLGELYRSLNRVILFQLSTIPSTEGDQKALMETLCMYSGQAHTIFDDTNVDTEFLECVTYRLLQVMFSNAQSSGQSEERWSTSYQPMAQSVMKSGANRLWQRILELKHDSLKTLLSVELPVPTSTPPSLMSVINTAATSTISDLPPPTPPPTSLSPPSAPFPCANPQFLRLQGCQPLLTQTLTKAWDSYLISERNTPGLDSISRSSRGSEKKSLLRSSVSRKKEKEVMKQSVVEGIVREYVDVLCPLLVMAAVKYEDMITLKHQRNMDYRLRFTVLEWSRIEWELTRERGLWGPGHPSPLDKWMLDTVEGPYRMRKRMCRNHVFYHDYPYDPNEPISAKKSKHQKPVSAHSKLHFVLQSMFQRPTVLSGNMPGSHSNKPLPFALPGNDALLSMSIEYPSGVASESAFTSNAEDPTPPSPHLKQTDIFPKSSEDDPVSQAIAKMIEPDDEIIAKFQSARLTGLDSKDGVLLLGGTHFYVIEGVTLLNRGGLVDIESAANGSYDPVLPAHLHLPSATTEAVPIGCVKWPYAVVREIHKRRYLLRRCALEVFSSDGRNQFLIFHINQRDKLYQKLKSRCSNLAESGNDTVAGTNPDRDPEQAPGLLSVFITGDKSPATRWANGEMSNFQYLMQLNTLAGRSYNDLMQYPIFPWVLADYESHTLDLTNPATFRDFSLPMGAQSEERLRRFIERYNLTKEDPTGEGIPPYYYGTHYSSAMIVASYLIRMEPFTGHFIKLQGGHFDLADRLFHSIPVAWVSASSTNMADVKELIPEFFYLPDFLKNTNHFDLGTKQSGEVLGDVILPPWAKCCPIEFIRLHREALESDYVSAHLHEWIDLIFGYKQMGKEALKAHNVFHHLFYEGAVDIDRIDDPVKKGAAISFIHNFGQMPKQLFKRPHPSRKVFSHTINPSLSAPPVAMDTTRVFYKNLTQLMPSREPVKEIRGEVHHISLVGDRNLLALDRNKLPLPPLYSRYFMWGFPDRSTRVAFVEADKVVSVFENLHQGRILCAAMGGDNMLLTGGDSTIVCVWEMKNIGSKDRSPVQLQLKHTLHGHTDAVSCIAASAAYNIIVSGSKDQTCIIWDINKMVFVRQLRDHSGSVTIVVINQSNGNIVSCTKSQICLWTVNGTLLASTTFLMTGSFHLLCCAVSEMFDWDQDNVIVTGSSDGIVRMWVVEYVKEGETPRSPVKRKKPEDRPPSSEHVTLHQEDLSVTDGGMSSDSEDDIYENTPTADAARERVDGGDNPLYHSDSEKETHTETPLDTSRTITHSELDRREAIPHSLHIQSDASCVSNSLLVIAPERGRASSLRDVGRSEGERGGGVDGLGPRQRSRSHELVSRPRGGEGGVRDECDSQFARIHDQPCNITIKTQIDTSESDGTANTMDGGAEETPEVEHLPTSPVLAQYLEDTKKKARELREKTGQWSRRLTQVHQLTMHTAVSRKDNDSPAAITSLHISRDHRRLFVGDSRGRVFSWTVSDTQGGVMEHWLRDEAVDKCMRCNVEFTFTERKHHCRDCGKIFCYRCSGYESEVKRLRIFKKVRVCEDCYRNLRPKQSPKT